MDEDKSIKENKNYYNEFVKLYKEIRKKEKDKPKLLLHVCCAACSAYPLVFLIDLFDITILYTNSNIYPKEEFDKRLYYLKKYVSDINTKFKTHIEIVVDNYDYDVFKKDLEPYKNEKEMGTRCKICIAKRFNQLFEYAKNNNFKYVTSVMSISRNKDVNYLNELGLSLENKYKDYDIKYIVSDFKKNNGQDLGIKIAKEFNIYRQDYCGCEYSLPKEHKPREISVIVPIHGVYEYLDKCLDSLVHQNIEVSYEVVCVLDSPLEQDREITYKYQTLFPDLVTVHEVNFKDLSEVRNYGLLHSYSRYVAFVDGDDYVSPTYLKDFYEDIVKKNSDIVVCNYYMAYPNKIKKCFPSNPLIFKPRNSLEACRSLCRDIHLRGYVWNKFFKREIIENKSIFFMSFRYCIEDYFFVFSYLLNINSISFINKYNYYYVQRPSSVVHKDDGSLIKKLINSQFLVKYYAFKENRPETTKISYFFKEIALIYSIIIQRKNLQIPLKEFISSTRKQIKKIKKNEYLYEGEDWEKVVASYIEKQNKDFYIDKGK